MKILHISDLHTHHENETNAELLKRIESLRAFPDHTIIITGDITDDGREDQYDKAIKALGHLPSRILVLPGNHDYGVLGNFYEEEKAIAFDTAFLIDSGPFLNKIPVMVQIENVLFILLNSNLETVDPFDFACGKIGIGQLGLLCKVLDDPITKGLIKVVALHHHPFIHSDPTMKLLDSDRFMRAIYGKVDVLLFGHRHVEAQWINKSGCGFILAAAALYDSNGVKEIMVEGKDISVNKIQFVNEVRPDFMGYYNFKKEVL